MKVIDSFKLERDAGGKPVPTFPHPAPAQLSAEQGQRSLAFPGAHILTKDFDRAANQLEHFQAKWIPVRRSENATTLSRTGRNLIRSKQDSLWAFPGEVATGSPFRKCDHVKEK